MMKVLLVEDNPIAAMAASEMIEGAGCLVEVASTGQQALERYHDDFDLILLDIGLPDISGIEVVSEIRTKENPNKHIPMIALTAHEKGEIKAKALQAGVDKVIVKPLNLDKLSKALGLSLKN